MYTASIVNYYNTTPFLFGINKSPIKHDLNIQLDIPSVCAQKLKAKQVDIGLVPVAILPELESYHIITDYCIGANGKVDSVKLFSQKPLHELTHIVLDYQSKTSVTLVKVLNTHFWKLPIKFVNGSEGFEANIKDTTGAVIIGDRTFGLTGYAYEFDLSEEWKKYTGLPFVFACWVSNDELDASFISNFNNALAYGTSHIDDAIADKPIHIKGFDATDYLKNKISYNLDADKKKGLELFLELMKK
jgi:chorismate dehydratase